MMIEPKEITVKNSKGEDKAYIVSKIPAVPAREIAFKYPTSAIPKIGEYETNKDVMFKIMKYVAIPRGEGKEPLALVTEELINNHVDCWETLLKIEVAMMDYNCSFFRNGRAFDFLGDVARKYLRLTIKTLSRFAQQLSKMEKPHSMS